MVFSSALFLFYFLPIFLLGYFLIPKGAKNIYALVGSLGFYVWGAPSFIGWVTIGIIADFIIGQKIDKAELPKYKFRWLWVGLVLNIALLGYFKYANFFVENFVWLGFMQEGSWTKVLLPIGISFFTFQKISYLVDVYRKQAAAAENLWDYALYVLLFPQLIAGPIVRYKEVAEQILERPSIKENLEMRLAGLTRFAIGLGKKVLIADVLGREVDKVFYMMSAEGFEPGTPYAWIIILAYTFQIYFDFSGYSDMAIGMGRMMGFNFPENFNFPYIARTMTEFWRRWHMTLSNWMRDYLYIPLGGNRIGGTRTYINLWLVFLISGFWHGASWNFVAWGAFHGLFLTLDRMLWGNFWKKVGWLPAVLFTFWAAMMSWVLFRAESLGQAIQFYKELYKGEGEWPMLSTEFVGILMVAGILVWLPLIPSVRKGFRSMFASKEKPVYQWVQTLIIVVLLWLASTEIMVSDYSPFIYYRF
ncbi:MAG: MBOAT family protein [Bacteroidota bacterium]